MPAANAADFFGEGTVTGPGAPAKPKRDWTAQPPRTNAELDEMLRETGGTGLNFDFQDTRTAEERAVGAFQSGNFGATSGYAQGNQATRSAYDAAHATTQPVGFGRVPGLVANYLGNAQANLNPFDGAPQNVRNAAHQNAAVDDYANREALAEAERAATAPGVVIDVPTNPNAGVGTTAPSVGTTTGTGTPTGAGGAPPATTPAPGTDGAPVLGRDKIDEALGGLSTYEAALWNISQDNTGLSAAEEQLKKATALANIQAGINTEASQRAALGQARSARNRGDRAFLEQQAIGEAGFIGQEAARTASLRQAEAEGNLATLRANEETADRTFKRDAIIEAAKLGLNVAAIELDVAKADLSSASNMLNQVFESMRAEGTLALGYANLDQEKVRDAANFTRDMAIIQQKYDEMDVTAQIEAEKILAQRYGIDQQTLVALKKIQADQSINWSELAVQFIAGAGKGAAAGAAA